MLKDSAKKSLKTQQKNNLTKSSRISAADLSSRNSTASIHWSMQVVQGRVWGTFKRMFCLPWTWSLIQRLHLSDITSPHQQTIVRALIMPAVVLVREWSQIGKLHSSSIKSFKWLTGHKYSAWDSQLFNTYKTKEKKNSERPRINLKKHYSISTTKFKHLFLKLNILSNTAWDVQSLITMYRTPSGRSFQISKLNFKNHPIRLKTLENNQSAF